MGTNDGDANEKFAAKLACTQTFFLFFSKIDDHASEAGAEHESEGGARERKSFCIFSHHHPLALAVFKSSAIFLFMRALDDLLRENGRSVNRL